MKTISKSQQNYASNQPHLDNGIFHYLIINPMKRLANVSPFILLLAPVFLMMVISLTFNELPTQDQDLTIKSTTHKGASGIIKSAISVFQ